MSVECAVFIVDWDDLQDQLRHTDDFTVLIGEINEEDEMVEGSGLPAEPVWSDLLGAQSGFLGCFDRFAHAWDPESRARFQQVFGTLFPSWYPEVKRVMELTGGDDNLSGINTALSPSTTRKLAQQANLIRLEECRGLFEQYVKDRDRFRSFDEFDAFKRYGEDWLGILGRAAEANEGVVVYVYG